MPRPRRVAPDFGNMDPQEGARALLRYLFDSIEEERAVSENLLLRMDRLERYVGAIYAMVEEAYRASGGKAVQTVAASAQVPHTGAPVDQRAAAVAEAIGRGMAGVASRRLADWLVKKGLF